MGIDNEQSVQSRHLELLVRQAARLTDHQADHAILQLYLKGVINTQRASDVLAEWNRPSFPDLDERNAWHSFNAVTFALNGKVMEKPTATPTLHRVIDSVCGKLEDVA